MLELNAVIFDMDGLMIDTEPVGNMLVKHRMKNLDIRLRTICLFI